MCSLFHLFALKYYVHVYKKITVEYITLASDVILRNNGFILLE
jgi:hypothetical protein